MLDEKTRNAIALKKFSIISPILNGQVKNLREYCAQVAASPFEMPHYGSKQYSPKTVELWYYDYMRYGLDALKPKPRSDKGGTRKVTAEIADILASKRSEFPRAPVTVIYDMMVAEGHIIPADISLSTVTRYLNKVSNSLIDKENSCKEMKRFSHGKVNQLWQTDVMCGPYVKRNGKNCPTYLLAYIDDCSRLILHAQFYHSQDFLSLRSSFREAVLRRGIPKLLYTDNGKIYRCSNFEYLCANLGVTLIRAEPYTPTSKGKIERFFRSCRLRFLSTLNPQKISSIEELNELFWKWLSTDYNEKEHSSIGTTPLNCFLSQASSITLPSDLSLFNEKFLVKVARSVKHDATLSLNRMLYETPPELAGMKVDVRYDPDLLEQGLEEIFLYEDDKCIGTARRVHFSDNAVMKRPGRSNPKVVDKPRPAEADPVKGISDNPCEGHKNTIDFSTIMKEGEYKQCSLNISD